MPRNVVVSRGTDTPLANYPGDPGPPIWRGPSSGHVPLIVGPGMKPAAATYEAMYRTQPWLYAVVNRLVYGVARMGLYPYSGVDGDVRKRDRTSSLARLLMAPYPRRSGWDLRVAVMMDLLLQGEMLAVPWRRSLGSEPSELWPVPWRYVQTIEDNRGILAYKIFGNTANPVTLTPEQVIHYQLPLRTPPIEPLRRTLALENGYSEKQSNTLATGAAIKGIYTTKTDVRDDGVLDNMRDKLKALYGGPNGETVAVVSGDGKWEKLEMSPVDLDLINARKFNREEVVAAFGQTLQQLGLSDKAAYASLLESNRAFYVDALGPFYTLIEEQTNAQLVAPEKAWDGLFVEFNVDAMLRPDPEARARMHLMMQQAGVNATNERRRYENLPPEGDVNDPDNEANKPLRPVNMVPIGAEPVMIRVTETAPPDESGAPGPPSNDQADPAALIDGLPLLKEAFRAGIPAVPETEQEGDDA